VGVEHQPQKNDQPQGLIAFFTSRRTQVFLAQSVCGCLIFSNANVFALTGWGNFIHAHTQVSAITVSTT
jgi:hypothetical protein